MFGWRVGEGPEGERTKQESKMWDQSLPIGMYSDLVYGSKTRERLGSDGVQEKGKKRENEGTTRRDASR